MARDTERHVCKKGALPAAPPCTDDVSKLLKIQQIEAAMTKIARALPSNSGLSAVWARLEKMHLKAVTELETETEVQKRARAWLEGQKEIPSRRSAMSDSDKPAP